MQTSYNNESINDQASAIDGFQTGSRHVKWRGGIDARTQKNRSKAYRNHGIGVIMASNSAATSNNQQFSLDEQKNRFIKGLQRSIEVSTSNKSEIQKFTGIITAAQLVDMSFIRNLPVGIQRTFSITETKLGFPVEITYLNLGILDGKTAYVITASNKSQKPQRKTPKLTLPQIAVAPKTLLDIIRKEKANKSQHTRRTKKADAVQYLSYSKNPQSNGTGNTIKGFDKIIRSSKD